MKNPYFNVVRSVFARWSVVLGLLLGFSGAGSARGEAVGIPEPVAPYVVLAGDVGLQGKISFARNWQTVRSYEAGVVNTVPVVCEEMSLADDMAILRRVTTGKGNFGVGTAGYDDAMRLGRSWVGEGAKSSSNGMALISPDGLKQFRAPSLKPNSPYATTGSQANFEWRNIPKGKWQGNGHLNVALP